MKESKQNHIQDGINLYYKTTPCKIECLLLLRFKTNEYLNLSCKLTTYSIRTITYLNY